MATGDVNSRYIGRAGNLMSVSGTFDADGAEVIYLSGQKGSSITDASGSTGTDVTDDRAGNRIVSCMVTPAGDLDDKSFYITLNSNDNTADTLNGAIYISTDDTGNDSYHYTALMQL